MYQTLSGGYPRRTRSAAIGQIRQDNIFTSQSTFKYRAMKYFNSVTVNVTVGSTATVKKTIRRSGSKQIFPLTRLDHQPVSIYSYIYILLYYF